MTVFRRRRAGTRDRVFSYEFVYAGQRYRGSTGQLTKDDAEVWEREEKKRVRRVVAGLEVDRPVEGIKFQEWAEQYFEIKSREVTSHDRLEFLIRCVLRFFGAKPDPKTSAIDPTAPYHDLRLTDVVRERYWVERFEQWLREPDAQGRIRSPQTRNHYRSGVSGMYEVACRPTFQGVTGVSVNPFAGIQREKRRKRRVTISPSDFRALLTHASYHVRLALSIGALAPTLRYASVLSLQWSQISKDWTYIRVDEHKTDDITDAPQMVPVSSQLREILQHAKARAPRKSKYVVTYRGKRLKSIRDGVRAAALQAGIKYGRGEGFTFHYLRHTAPTVLSGLGVNAFVLRDLMGHADITMTAEYTHAVTPVVAAAAEQLSGMFQVTDLVTAQRTRARRQSGGDFGGDSIRRPKKTGRKTTDSGQGARTTKSPTSRSRSTR